MRVTNALTTRSIIERLQVNSQALAKAQQRATSGKKVELMSDDPTAGSTIMQASTALRGIEQYQRNVSQVSARLDAEDTALGQVTELLTRARELATAGATGTADVSARRTMGKEVRQLLAQALDVGNTVLGGEYLFGGQNAGTPPFDPSRATAASHPFATLDADTGTTPVATGERFVEVAAGQKMAGAHDGRSVFLDTNVFGALQQLADALDPTGTPPADQQARVGTAGATVVTAFTALQGFVGDVGARQNQADTLKGGLDALQSTLSQQKSGLAEVDMEQAITEMLARQTAYQAAMLASSKVMGMSLTDYLR